MFTCDLRFHAMLGTKFSTGERFAIVVRIRLLLNDDGSGRWSHLGTRDYRMPTGGNVIPALPDLHLTDTNNVYFATLTRFDCPPSLGSTGSISVNESSGPPLPGQQLRHTGKWTLLNVTVSPTVTEASWRALWTQFSQMMVATEWYVKSVGNWSVAGGGGGYGGEYSSGTVILLRDSDNPDAPGRRLSYSAVGGGWMTPGVGGSLAPEWFWNVGSYVVRGTLTSGEAFRLEDLAGPCAIIEGSGSVTGLPIPKYAHIPVRGGAGVSVTMFLFGTLGSVGSALFTSYTAGAVVFGPAVVGTVSKKPSGNAALTVNIGRMSLIG